MTPTTPFSIRGLDHVVLRVTDVDACIKFYCEALGCSIEATRHDIGLVQLRAGTSIVDLVDCNGLIGKGGGGAPGEAGHNMDHFCLRLDPFDPEALSTHLTEHGIVPGEIISAWGADGRGPSMYITDPGGNTVELKGPPTHPYDPSIGYIAE